jgi:hypothetical protein
MDMDVTHIQMDVIMMVNGKIIVNVDGVKQRSKMVPGTLYFFVFFLVVCLECAGGEERGRGLTRTTKYK